MIPTARDMTDPNDAPLSQAEKFALQQALNNIVIIRDGLPARLKKITAGFFESLLLELAYILEGGV